MSSLVLLSWRASELKTCQWIYGVIVLSYAEADDKGRVTSGILPIGLAVRLLLDV